MTPSLRSDAHEDPRRRRVHRRTNVLIAVCAPHRADALAACRDAIDTLKERVPLWKKEVYEGGEEWIGRGS
jgi:molybdopterin synthase catalytic subunit